MSGPFNPRGTPPSIPGTFAGWPQNGSKPTIQLGSTGDAVRYLEGALYWASGFTGIYVDPVGTWCLFTNGDRSAVLSFQSWWGITVDGIVGPQTWNCIDTSVWAAGMS